MQIARIAMLAIFLAGSSALIAEFQPAIAEGLPSPEAGAPLTGQWVLVVALLLFLGLINTVVGKLTVGAVNRGLAKKDAGDEQQNRRLQALDEQQHEQDIRHREEIHSIQLELLKCQKEYCSRAEQWVSKDEHHGDILRIENKIDAAMAEVKSTVATVHRRVDSHMINRGEPQ